MTTKLIIVNGQSNAGSQGKKADLDSDWLSVGSRVKLYCPQTKDKTISPVPHSSPKFNNKFGVELGAQAALEFHSPASDWAFARRFKGGASITQWCNNLTCNNTQWNKIVSTTNQAITKLGGDVEVVGVFWIQIEADDTNNEVANYQQRLTNYINAHRAQWDNPDLPFVFIRPHTSTGAAWYQDLVDAVEAVEANVPHTRLVETIDLPTWSDGIHFNSEGNLLLGQRMAEAYIDIIS